MVVSWYVIDQSLVRESFHFTVSWFLFGDGPRISFFKCVSVGGWYDGGSLMESSVVRT